MNLEEKLRFERQKVCKIINENVIFLGCFKDILVVVDTNINIVDINTNKTLKAFKSKNQIIDVELLENILFISTDNDEVTILDIISYENKIYKAETCCNVKATPNSVILSSDKTYVYHFDANENKFTLEKVFSDVKNTFKDTVTLADYVINTKTLEECDLDVIFVINCETGPIYAKEKEFICEKNVIKHSLHNDILYVNFDQFIVATSRDGVDFIIFKEYELEIEDEKNTIKTRINKDGSCVGIVFLVGNNNNICYVDDESYYVKYKIHGFEEKQGRCITLDSIKFDQLVFKNEVLVETDTKDLFENNEVIEKNAFERSETIDEDVYCMNNFSKSLNLCNYEEDVDKKPSDDLNQSFGESKGFFYEGLERSETKEDVSSQGGKDSKIQDLFRNSNKDFNVFEKINAASEKEKSNESISFEELKKVTQSKEIGRGVIKNNTFTNKPVLTDEKRFSLFETPGIDPSKNITLGSAKNTNTEKKNLFKNEKTETSTKNDPQSSVLDSKMHEREEKNEFKKIMGKLGDLKVQSINIANPLFIENSEFYSENQGIYTNIRQLYEIADDIKNNKTFEYKMTKNLEWLEKMCDDLSHSEEHNIRGYINFIDSKINGNCRMIKPVYYDSPIKMDYKGKCEYIPTVKSVFKSVLQKSTIEVDKTLSVGGQELNDVVDLNKVNVSNDVKKANVSGETIKTPESKNIAEERSINPPTPRFDNLNFQTSNFPVINMQNIPQSPVKSDENISIKNPFDKFKKNMGGFLGNNLN